MEPNPSYQDDQHQSGTRGMGMPDLAPPKDRLDSVSREWNANRRAPARPLERIIGPSPRAASGVGRNVDSFSRLGSTSESSALERIPPPCRVTGWPFSSYEAGRDSTEWPDSTNFDHRSTHSAALLWNPDRASVPSNAREFKLSIGFRGAWMFRSPGERERTCSPQRHCVPKRQYPYSGRPQLSDSFVASVQPYPLS